jgi:biopolymer transport protein ExbD
VNLRPGRREHPDINLTPLIDIVFLLLIFFMVSTTFRKEAGLEVDLPEASEAVRSEGREQLTITIDARGRYAVNDRVLIDERLETLKSAISAAAGAGDRRNLPLIVRADGNTPHRAVVKAMDVAGQLGFRQLGIATIESPSQGPRDGKE